MTASPESREAGNPLFEADLGELVWESGTMIAATVDSHGIVLAANANLVRLLGTDPVGRAICETVGTGQEETFLAWVVSADDRWSSRSWGITPAGADLVPLDYRIAARNAGPDLIMLVGEPLRTDDVAADLLAVNASLVSERRRLGRERVVLDRKVHQDSLTRIANRGAFDARLALEVVLAGPERAFALVMLDIDHFKLLNDRFGHQAGDEVLRWLGGQLRDVARKDDFVGRYGGEEFVAILPNAGSEDARSWADRLCRVVRETEIPGVETMVTMSVGVATWQPGDDDAGLLERADRALYQAKEGGRDRVVIG